MISVIYDNYKRRNIKVVNELVGELPERFKITKNLNLKLKER